MVQMLALQRVYVFSQRKEYPEGATFSISDTREADSLRLMKKAQIVPDKPKHVDLPKQAPAQTKQEVADDNPKKGGGRGRTYQRRDMVATDGPIGEDIPLPSSLLDPPSKESTSPDSEDEQG